MTLRGADARAIPRVALAQLGVAVVLLGAAWPVTKVALLDGAAPAWFALGRAGLALAVAALALGVMGRLRVPGRVDLPAVLSLGLLQLGGFFTLAHAAVAWVPAGRTAILSNATLVWAVPIALLVTREAVPARRWVATALGAAGVVVLVGPWAIDWTSVQVLAGHAFLLGAALCWAVTMAVVRRWPPRMSMLALLPWAFGLASLMLLPLALLHDPGRWTGAGVACLVMVGAVMGADRDVVHHAGDDGVAADGRLGRVPGRARRWGCCCRWCGWTSRSRPACWPLGAALILGGAAGGGDERRQAGMILKTVRMGQGSPAWCCCTGCSGRRATGAGCSGGWRRRMTVLAHGPAQPWRQPA